MKKKFALMATSLVLVAALAVGGTLAWLTDQTDPITNTFTVGKVEIDLTETMTDFKMVPGNPIDKDPKVTVKAGSENSWVFVKVEESDNLNDFIEYSVDTGWTALDGVDGVYYREYPVSDTDTGVYSVLANNQVMVKNSVTTDMMNDLIADDPNTADVDESTYPTLTFTAYAIQKDGFTTAADAWAEVIKAAPSTP